MSNRKEQTDIEGSPLPIDVVDIYFKDALGAPLLDHAEEIRLAKIIKHSKSKEERAAAREKLTTSNLRLVVNFAAKYAMFRNDLPDVIQNGNLGLMEAVEKYDYTRGHRFSTYASWWIRMRIDRETRRNDQTIRIPLHSQEKKKKLRQIEDQLTQKLGRIPSEKEIAKVANVGLQSIKDLRHRTQTTLSLESKVKSEEGGLSLEETIIDEDTLPTSDQITNKILRQLLIEAMEKLPPRHANIILMRYGFKDGHQYTLEEIGQKYGVTREWVRQMEAWSINKLRGRFPRLADFL